MLHENNVGSSINKVCSGPIAQLHVYFLTRFSTLFLRLDFFLFFDPIYMVLLFLATYCSYGLKKPEFKYWTICLQFRQM